MTLDISNNVNSGLGAGQSVDANSVFDGLFANRSNLVSSTTSSTTTSTVDGTTSTSTSTSTVDRNMTQFVFQGDDLDKSGNIDSDEKIMAWLDDDKDTLYVDTNHDGNIDNDDLVFSVNADGSINNAQKAGKTVTLDTFIESQLNNVVINATNVSSLAGALANRNSAADTELGRDVTSIISYDATSNVVSIKYGQDGSTVAFDLDNFSEADLKTIASALAANSEAGNVFSALVGKGPGDAKVGLLLEAFILSSDSGTSSILLRDLMSRSDADTIIGNVVAELVGSSAGLDKLASIMLNGEAPLNTIFAKLSDANIQAVFSKMSGNEIAPMFHYHRLSDANKLTLAMKFADDPAWMKSKFDAMSANDNRAAFNDLLGLLSGVTDSAKHEKLLNVLEQFVTSQVQCQSMGFGVEMFNDLNNAVKGTASLSQSAKDILNTLTNNQVKAMLMDWDLQQTNAIMDHLGGPTPNRAEAIVASMSTDEMFNLLDREVLDSTHYNNFLNQIVGCASATPTAVNVVDGFTSNVKSLLLRDLPGNVGSHPDIRDVLISKLSDAGKLSAVLHQGTAGEAAALIGLLSGASLIKVGQAISSSSFRFFGGNEGYKALNALNTIDMKRVVDTWGGVTSTGAATSTGRDSLLSTVIAAAPQATVNNWLSSLAFTWKTPPDLTNLGAGLNAIGAGSPESLINGDTAKLLVQATPAGTAVIKSAFVQEALSAGIGKLDFKNPTQAILELMSGLLVNDASVFLQALDMAAQTIGKDGNPIIDASAITQINAALDVTWGGGKLELGAQGWTVGGKSVFQDGGTYSFDSASGLTVGAEILMQIKGVPPITVSTQMSLDQKLRMLDQAFKSSNQADVVAKLLISINDRKLAGSANQAAAATLVLDAMINGYKDASGKQVITAFTGLQLNATLFELAKTAKGMALLDVYLLADDSLHSRMFEDFVAYTMDQSGGVDVLANVLNSNFDGGAGKLSNGSLNQILQQIGLLAAGPLQDLLAKVQPETLAAILDNDDAPQTFKDQLIREVVAHWSDDKIAQIFNVDSRSAASTATDGIDIGLSESVAESLILSLGNKLSGVLATMSGTQVKAVLSTGDGIDGAARMAVFTQLRASNNTDAIAYLLGAGQMFHTDQEALLTGMSSNQLNIVVGKMDANSVASLIGSAEGFGSAIMTQIYSAANGIAKSADVLKLLGPSQKGAFVGILNGQGAPAGDALKNTLAQLGVDSVRTLLQSSMPGNANQLVISQLFNALQANGVAKLLNEGVPALHSSQQAAIIVALSPTQLSSALSTLAPADVGKLSQTAGSAAFGPLVNAVMTSFGSDPSALAQVLGHSCSEVQSFLSMDILNRSASIGAQGLATIFSGQSSDVAKNLLNNSSSEAIQAVFLGLGAPGNNGFMASIATLIGTASSTRATGFVSQMASQLVFNNERAGIMVAGQFQPFTAEMKSSFYELANSASPGGAGTIGLRLGQIQSGARAPMDFRISLFLDMMANTELQQYIRRS